MNTSLYPGLRWIIECFICYLDFCAIARRLLAGVEYTMTAELDSPPLHFES